MLRIISTIFVLLMFTACSERIVHDVSEHKANKIIVALARSGIDANKTREGSLWSIKVPGSKSTLALKFLQEARLLESEARKKQKSSSSFIQNNQERNRTLGNQIAEELENTLERFPQVVEAHVHLNIAGKKLLMANEHKKGSASVLLVSDSPDTIQMEDIQQIVSGAAGLETLNVSVVVVKPEKRAWPTPKPSPLVSQSSMVNQKSLIGIIVSLFAVFVVSFLLKKTSKEKSDFKSSLSETSPSKTSLPEPTIIAGKGM